MLQVGRLGCPSHTHGCAVKPELLNWTKTHFAAFCIVSSPLVLSIVPSDETLAPILDIIGNKQAMAINQAWAGHPGTLVRTLPPVTPPCPACEGPGTVVVGVACNASDATTTCWAYDATVGHITHGGLCLSAEVWGKTLNLYSCGNASTHQNFTYDAKAKTFQTQVAAPVKLYPGNLEIGSKGVAGAGIQKAYVGCHGCSAPSMQFSVASGTIRNGNGECLAARGDYMPPSTTGVAGVQVWAKPLGQGKTAALFLNGGSTEYTASLTLKELNITGATAKVTDVWTGEDAGSVANGEWSTGVVPEMDSRFVVFSS